MNTENVTFQNKSGEQLSGKLELPPDRHPHNFAIFAHCFTCSKNLLAVKNISRALTKKGFGVLRFDFTGLGESEGDFKDTNFSGNVEDLIAAAAYVAENYKKPSLLVGHSLGGAAALFAAAEIESIQAVATIGAPADPEHVNHLFKSSLEKIEKEGKAVVTLAGREFTIKKQFVDDLKNKSLAEVVKNMRKSLLVMHSPQDNTVGISNAKLIYEAAFHPKSFISLDGADHLLQNKKDSLYAGEVIASWAQRYIELPDNLKLHTEHEVVASLDTSNGFTTQMKLGEHYITADEPESAGGHNFGPTPYEFLSAGLAACTAMTIKMYARFKKWELENIEVHIDYSKEHASDCENCESSQAKIDTFKRELKITGNLDDTQKAKLLEIADKCPVHRTLHNEIRIKTNMIS